VEGLKVVVGILANLLTFVEETRNTRTKNIAAEIDGQLLVTWSASGTHTAKGYTSESAETASVEGLKQDCDNIIVNQ
jgi:hypothetical protein